MKYKYPEDRDLMEHYNILDVEVMRALAKQCRELTDEEWAEYHLTCKINERGLPIDTEFADQAIGYANEVADDANTHIERLTGGKMTKHTQRKARDAWLFPKLKPHQMKLLEVYKNDIKKTSLDYDHRQYLLACEDLDADARELLEYLDNAGSSSLKKFSVAHHQNVKGRVHNTFRFNGAGQTGRFSGMGLQPHNIRRDVFSHNEAEALIADVIDQREVPTPASTLARLMRSVIKSKTGQMQWVDYSSIEARMSAWLSNCDAGEDVLDIFRGGHDIYKIAAVDMFGVSVDEVSDDQRQQGKICVLALGYAGGVAALQSMAKNYGAAFDDTLAANLVKLWRTSNKWATYIWGEYQRAIDDAVREPFTECPVGRVTYFSDNDNYLWCRLPSGRLLSYPRPYFEEYFTPWDEQRVGPTYQSHFKPAAGDPPLRNFARGALLFQHSTQAAAADLLRLALVKADAAGLNIVLHCHDEIVIDSPDPADGDLLNEIMLDMPDWAEGLPVTTGGVARGKRWGK
mgnify:CR=1 FL=1|tara:strand:- start:1091 stop:2635 length:1545 start_codon:yes stop_codon:yes gene_type:complete